MNWAVAHDHHKERIVSIKWIYNWKYCFRWNPQVPSHLLYLLPPPHHVIIPCRDITGMTEYLVPWIRSLWSQGGIYLPLTEYLYLLRLLCWSHPVSSIQTSMDGSYIAISAMNRALHSSERCGAMCCILCQLHPVDFRFLQIVRAHTSTQICHATLLHEKIYSRDLYDQPQENHLFILAKQSVWPVGTSSWHYITRGIE